MDNMELVIKTDLNTIPEAIDFNFEQIKSGAEQALAKYQGRIVTEDGIKDAKKDKATLNAFRTALEDERKRIKKICLSPYDAFEKKEKVLVGMVDEPLRAIDDQLKAFDEQKKAKKQDSIREFFNSNVGALESLLSFDKVFNPRWMNATYKMSDIEKEITDTIFKVGNDVRIIKAMRLDCEQQMLDTYLRTLDMSAAMAEKTRWEEQQDHLKKYEAEQKKAAQGVAEARTKQPDLAESFPAPFDTPPAECTPQETLKTIKVIFYDTSATFRHEMRALTEKYNVKYGGLK